MLLVPLAYACWLRVTQTHNCHHGPKQYALINSLRLIAAHHHVLFHWGLPRGNGTMNSLFWFLSGFFLSKSQKKPLESLSKRLSRIYPLYVFYLLMWTIFSSVSKNHLLTSLMLIAGEPMFFPLWSVFSETL